MSCQGHKGDKKAAASLTTPGPQLLLATESLEPAAQFAVSSTEEPPLPVTAC